MTLKTGKFIRKPFYIDAVQVTAENIQEVADWCQGEVRTVDNTAAPGTSNHYVKVRVHHALTERQTKAFVGDWVLYAGAGFKVYTPKAFENSFEMATGIERDQATQTDKSQPALTPVEAKKAVAKKAVAKKAAMKVEPDPAKTLLQEIFTTSEQVDPENSAIEMKNVFEEEEKRLSEKA